MTCDRVAELLPDWLEGGRGGSGGGELAELQEHLDGCTECRTLTADLQRIILAAGSLPVHEPGSDLWPGIASRISTNGQGAAAPADTPGVLSIESGRSRLRRWRAPLAAAATVLIIALGSLSILPDGQVDWPPIPRTADVSPGSSAIGSTLASDQWTGAELLADSYGSEIAAMTELLETQRPVLDSATVSVLERNLAIIDAAIAESREALERDPASAHLTEQLNTAYDLKLDVMRRAVLLTSGA